MNKYYTKTLLYAYPHFEDIAEQIDDLVLRKALASMKDFSPCEEQCEKIITLTCQKDVLFDLKIKLEKIIKRLTDYEKDCLDYKYFKQRKKEYFLGFDCISRKYFRRQIALVEKIGKMLEKLGVDDKYFKQKCLSVNFFCELHARVVQREKQTQRKCKKNANVLKNSRLIA